MSIKISKSIGILKLYHTYKQWRGVHISSVSVAYTFYCKMLLGILFLNDQIKLNFSHDQCEIILLFIIIFCHWFYIYKLLFVINLKLTSLFVGFERFGRQLITNREYSVKCPPWTSARARTAQLCIFHKHE